MAEYCKKERMICFDLQELKNIFELSPKKIMLEEIIKNKFSFEDTFDKSKKEKIFSTVKIINDKEDYEIFTALYILSDFYNNSKICFIHNNKFNPIKDQIKSIVELKKYIEDDNIVDFALMDKKFTRSFQLKKYIGLGKVKDVVHYIKTKVIHYGNDIGNTNFLVTLNMGGAIEEDHFFQKIHNELKLLRIKGTGHILLMYNEENKFMLIKTIFPEIGTTKIPLPIRRK